RPSILGSRLSKLNFTLGNTPTQCADTADSLQDVCIGQHLQTYLQPEGAIVQANKFASVWPDHGDFRSIPVNGHSQDGRACLKGARSSLICPINFSARSSRNAKFSRPTCFTSTARPL